MLVIRTATLLDLRQIEVVVRGAYSGYIPRIGREPGPMLDDYASLISQGLVHVLDDGRVVGVVVLVPEPGAMLLDNVAVDPAIQGKGYGGLLLEFAEQEARRQGFGVIRLYTNVLMTENLALYSRLGYVETRRGQEKGYSRVYMEKRLLEHSRPI
jgi:GNAT superfamily N-acetyltransferase